jgi:hypothetical protein
MEKGESGYHGVRETVKPTLDTAGRVMLEF